MRRRNAEAGLRTIEIRNTLVLAVGMVTDAGRITVPLSETGKKDIHVTGDPIKAGGSAEGTLAPSRDPGMASPQKGGPPMTELRSPQMLR